MLGFIFGRTGTGKTGIIFDRMSRVPHSYLLVPDREAVIYERRVADAGVINADVLTFSRLCDYVMRRVGGFKENYIGDGEKKVMMWSVIRALSGSLMRYGSVSASDTVFSDKMIEARRELRRNMISPRALSDFSSSLPEGESSKGKLSDIALICAAYDTAVSKSYTDPDGALSATYEKLRTSGFFAGETVFIDAFTSFTREQYAVIGEIIRQAEDVTVTLPFSPEEDSDNPVFRSVCQTYTTLIKRAETAGKEISPPVILGNSVRGGSPCMEYVRKNIYSSAGNFAGTAVTDFSGIRIVKAAGSYKEAEMIASDIRTSVREYGLRYRDIAVVMRNQQQYDGIIDAVFSKYDIPFFISRRTDIRTRPLVKFVMSALDICSRGFDKRLLIPFLKTDLSDITREECLLLENYIKKWNISPRHFSDGYEWTMNPRGYKGELTEQDNSVLDRLSDIRKRILTSFDMLSRAVKGKDKSVRDIAAGVYDFIIANGVPEKTERSAERLALLGDKAGSNEMLTLYRVFCDALDGLVACCGDRKCTPSEFSLMLGMMLSRTDIGRIPTSVDEVLVSGATEAKLHGIKSLYIAGAEFGNFPLPVSDNGFFDEHDRELMKSAGITLGDDPEIRFSDEQYLFYSTMCAPNYRLTVSYREFSGNKDKNTISPQAMKLCGLFDGLCVTDATDIIQAQFPACKRAALEYASDENDGTRRAIGEFFADKNGGDEIIRREYPLSEENCELSPENAAEIFSGRTGTSYSRLEKYIMCRFSYFCRYELKLDDGKKATFGAVDIGNLMHFILEKSSRFIAGDTEADEDTIRATIDTEVISYLLKIFGSDAIPNRLSRTVRYLENSAVKFIGEMRQEFGIGRFRPMDFELTVGQDEKIAPMKLESEDGGSVVLRGKIDRVDAYESEEADGRLYVRVVDYKTGDKTFKMSNIKLGLDLQMLLYLFSLCDNGKEYYGKSVLPAGVMYVGIKPPSLEISLDAGDENKPEKLITKSGLFLNDENVLNAMDPGLSGELIPVKYNAKGKIEKNVISAEALTQLREEISRTVADSFTELKRGIAHAGPISGSADANPCEYCEMFPVCRAKR